MQPVLHVSVQCPRCQQTLVVSTTDLQATVQCPRCAATHFVGHLVPPATPIAAVPVVTRPSAPSYPALAPASTPVVPVSQAPSYPATPAAAPQPGGAGYVHGVAPMAMPTPGVATPLPPSARVANAAGKAISHAVLAGVEGTRQVGQLGHWFLVTADRFDTWLYGKRAHVVSVFALLTVVVTAVEQHESPRAPLFTAIATGLFSLLLFLLGVARIGSLRGDDGSWSFGLVADRLATAWKGVAEQLSAFGEMKGPERAKAIGRGLMSIALVGLALRNIVLLLSIMADEFFGLAIDGARSVDETMLTAGMWVLGAGVILWSLGWFSLRTSPESKRLVLDAREREQLRAVASALPAVIDCSDKARTLELAGRIGHPVMKALLEVLVTWQPRGAENEADYQASLFRKLRREMPGANPERERPIGDRAQGTHGRADLVVSDSVLIEMKKGLTTTTAQRALGQIQMYLRAWDRGPVMLLVCEADAVTAQTFLAREIEEIRRRAPVMMVFAGRR